MEKMLIVEDDLNAVKVAVDYFSTKYEIVVAHDLKTALARLSETRFHLVITDLFYPQEQGSGKRDHVKELASGMMNTMKDRVKAKFLSEESLLKIKEGVEKWLNSDDEAVQPMGLKLIAHMFDDFNYTKQDVIMTTNQNHHAIMVEPIWVLVCNNTKFPFTKAYERMPPLYDCIGQQSKADRAFWENKVDLAIEHRRRR